MNVLMIPLDRIVVGERLRAVDPEWVATIAATMRERGQDTPIRVREADADGFHALVAGAHRVAAAGLAGLAEIAGIPFTGDQLAAELLEVDENLVRRELSELDRAIFLVKRKELYEALYPSSRHGGDRLSEQVAKNGHLVGPGSFAEATAEKLGLSDRTIRRIGGRARIIPEVRALIATTWLADHGAQLDALARLAPEEQRAVAHEMFTRGADERAPTVALALARARGTEARERDPTEAGFAALLNAWKKAGAPARAQFVAHLVQNNVVEPKATAGKAHEGKTGR